MNRKMRAKKIQVILNDLYPNPPIPLEHKDTYTLLIAVLLSARCTDKRVNQVTPALFAKASTPAAMVQISVEEITALIRICGLSQRKAKAIHDLSAILLARYEGNVPQNIEELEELPGIGHKTASVVMAQAFNVPSFPIDTHIQRCAKRWGLSEAKNVVQTERDLKLLFPKSTWNKLHLQIIYFARAYCQARGHFAASCPICSWLSCKDSKKVVVSQEEEKSD